MATEQKPYPEFAFIYAAPLDSSLLKSLLLFFDGVAIVSDPQRIALALQAEPWFFLPFLQSGLSKFVTPDDFFNQEYRKLHQAEIWKFIDSEVMKQRQPVLEPGKYLFPSQANFGFVTDDMQSKAEATRTTDRLLGSVPASGEGGELFEELVRRGLIATIDLGPGMPSQPNSFPPLPAPGLPAQFDIAQSQQFQALMEQSFKVPTRVLSVDSMVRQINDALIGQFARLRTADRFGFVVDPVNANELSLEQLLDYWRGAGTVAVGDMVLQDLEVVGASLELVSWDDLLSFREQHGAEHREYMGKLRHFACEVSRLPRAEQANAFYSRRLDIRKHADDLSRISRAKWKGPARFMLGIAGAALSAYTGNVPGGIISAGGALLGLGGPQQTAGAFTYLSHVAKM